LAGQFLSTYAVPAVALPHRSPFQQPELAHLMAQIILRYREHSTYLLHGFVILPDHMHLLLTPTDAIERAVQCLKGGFSFAVRDPFETRSGSRDTRSTGSWMPTTFTPSL
jgi:putative transposase